MDVDIVEAIATARTDIEVFNAECGSRNPRRIRASA
jgi:hypothetical protein